MPVSAWIMFGFGCLVLYGGFIICLVIAHRSRNVDRKEYRSDRHSKS